MRWHEDLIMDHFSNQAAPGPGQTIVIERAPRAGCLRRLVMPLVIVALVVYVASGLFSSESGMLPSRLVERYMAGEVSPSADKIAVVEVEGLLMGDKVDHAVRQIHQARDDKRVKAVILRVDSPGGTVSGSDRIWR